MYNTALDFLQTRHIMVQQCLYVHPSLPVFMLISQSHIMLKSELNFDWTTLIVNKSRYEENELIFTA